MRIQMKTMRYFVMRFKTSVILVWVFIGFRTHARDEFSRVFLYWPSNLLIIC